MKRKGHMKRWAGALALALIGLGAAGPAAAQTQQL